MTQPSIFQKPKRVIILGALSGIAEAAARQWADEGAAVLLAARDRDRLAAVAADIGTRGGQVETRTVDFATADVDASLAEMIAALGGADVVLLAYGYLGDQSRAETDLGEAARILDVNFTSAARWCLAAACHFEMQKSGTLIVLGSVAGDRGRASNYVYGAAKAGIATLVQGIAHRLAPIGARATVIKPGFVDTPMTAHIAGKGALWSKPAAIGKIIVDYARGTSRAPVVYAPGYWRMIMMVIRLVPATIFHRTKL